MTQIALYIDFDEDLHSKFQKEYESGNFSGAVKTSILFLTECIRDRTDLDLDGDSLITKALSPKAPLIKLNSLNTTSEIDEQTGHMMILQGIYKGIRNPRNHNLKTDDRFTCDSILTLINYYVKMIKKAKTLFDFNEIQTAVNDIHFDPSTEYASELAKTIPENKLLDTIESLLKIVDKSNYKNISYLLSACADLLSLEERQKLYSYCSKLLQKTENYAVMKALVFALHNVWNQIEKLSRIRAEGMLIAALRNADLEEEQVINEFGNYQTDYVLNEEAKLAKYLRFIPIPYTKKVPLITIHHLIESKLENSGLGVDYFLNFFHEFIFDNQERLKTFYNRVMSELLDQGNETLYKKLTAGSLCDGEFEPYYHYDDAVMKAIKRYEERKRKEPDNDIPF
jgi:uncharacterized protein (TIGR02391 family)